MEVRAGSGQQGFFEVRCNRGSLGGHTRIGLATREIDVNTCLGGSVGGWGWRPGGVNKFPGVPTPKPIPQYADGSVVGVMVDCSAAPTLRLFVDGQQVHQAALGPELLGKTIYPAVSLYNAEVSISASPALPAVPR